MKEIDIFNSVIDSLKDHLDYPESFSFKIDTQPFSKDRRKAAISFKIVQKKGFLKNTNLGKNFDKNLIDSKIVGKTFLVEFKANTEPRFLRNTIFNLKELLKDYPDYYPMIVSNFIGPSGRILCRNEDVSYLDTVGNIGLFLKDGFVLIESKESIKKESKELKSLFAPKSTRVIRIILESPNKSWRFEELSKISKISIGQVYKVINKLKNEELVTKTTDGIILSRPSDLLVRWSTEYDITGKNKIESFYITENSYEQVIKKLASVAENEKFNYAFTLFAGANMIIPFVRSQQVHLYLDKNKYEFIKKTGLNPVSSGANVHIISPYDEGVFNPIQVIKGVKVVGNIQLYLDLINYPARGKEQAEVLKEKLIGF